MPSPSSFAGRTKWMKFLLYRFRQNDHPSRASVEVTSAYLYTANTLPPILEAIQRAQVPSKLTNSFLQALHFKSTNNRAFINVWKGLGFLDGSSTPTEHYKAFRDKSI